MNFIIKKLASSEYFRNFTILSFGTIIAQAIPMIFYPIISRLFTPTDFGLLLSLMTVSGIVGTIITLGYESSIIITKNKSESINVISLTLLFSFLISLIVFCILSFVIDYIPFYSDNIFLKKYYWVSLVVAILIIIYNLYNEWSVKYKKFKRLSFNKMINSSSISFSQTFFGFIKLFSGVGLVFGDLLGRSFSALSCVYSFIRNDKESIKEISSKRMKEMFNKYIDCPRFIMPSKLLNTFGASLPVFFIGSCFSQYEIGLYAMANMVIAIPASIISIAMRDVFRQKAYAEFASKGSCRSILIITIKYLSIISFIGFSILFIIAPSIFSFVLGDKWLEAGVYARYLMPMVAISFISEVPAGIFIIVQKMKWELYWQIIYVVMLLSSLLIAVLYDDIYVLLIAISVSKSLTYLLNLYLSYTFSKGKE